MSENRYFQLLLSRNHCPGSLSPRETLKDLFVFFKDENRAILVISIRTSIYVEYNSVVNSFDSFDELCGSNNWAQLFQKMLHQNFSAGEFRIVKFSETNAQLLKVAVTKL